MMLLLEYILAGQASDVRIDWIGMGNLINVLIERARIARR